MQPSLTLCRAQEAQQRARAAGATLDNVRSQANIAAAAWAKEGDLAKKREDRKERARLEAALHLEIPASERGFSENPDRGFSEPEDEEE